MFSEVSFFNSSSLCSSFVSLILSLVSLVSLCFISFFWGPPPQRRKGALRHPSRSPRRGRAQRRSTSPARPKGAAPKPPAKPPNEAAPVSPVSPKASPPKAAPNLAAAPVTPPKASPPKASPPKAASKAPRAVLVPRDCLKPKAQLRRPHAAWSWTKKELLQPLNLFELNLHLRLACKTSNWGLQTLFPRSRPAERARSKLSVACEAVQVPKLLGVSVEEYINGDVAEINERSVKKLCSNYFNGWECLMI